MLDGKVWLIDADGNHLRAVTEELRYKADRPLTWSPDGSRLLYWSHSEIGWDIWTMDADGSNRKNLTNVKSGGCRSAAWSPDGKRIAFMRDDPAGLYVIGADGSKQQRLSTKGHRDKTPAWSPDGKRLLFTDFRKAGNEGAAFDVYMVNSDGANQKRIVENASDACWSADGKTVIFVGSRRGHRRLCRIDPEGGNETILTDGQAEESCPVRSPHGPGIAYLATDTNGKVSLCVLDIERKHSRQLANIEGEPRRSPSWSPDGKWLVFVSGATGKEAVWIVDADGKKARRLAQGNAESPVWRPRG